jgi:hypothetical protein
MVIGGHRGSERGLRMLERTELIIMLKRYREKAQASIKRERDDEDDDEIEIVEPPARKHRRGEDEDVIVLD